LYEVLSKIVNFMATNKVTDLEVLGFGLDLVKVPS
jgi:hypothetical protein